MFQKGLFIDEPKVNLGMRRQGVKKAHAHFCKATKTINNYVSGSTGILFDVGDFQMSPSRECFLISNITENDPVYTVEVRGYRCTLVHSGILSSGYTTGFHYYLNAESGSGSAGSNYLNFTQIGSKIKVTGSYGFKAGATYTLYVYNNDTDI